MIILHSQVLKSESLREPLNLYPKYNLEKVKDAEKIPQDSMRTKEDSLRYLKIEKFSKKSKLTQFLHNFLFRSVIPDHKKKIKIPKTNIRAEGKIIRKIDIVTLDPFGYSLNDTLKYPQGFFQKTANHLHLKTKTGIIKNLLLFKKYDRYDSLIVNESMRLLRSQRYIQDVFLYTVTYPKKRDSVDVFIRVLDVWSTVPSLSISPSEANLRLDDYNFAGLGNRFFGEIGGNFVTGENLARVGYYIPNIRNTHIGANFQYVFSSYNDLLRSNLFNNPYYSTPSSNLSYRFSGNRGIIKSFEMERPFYSPYANWAGGIFWGQMVTAQGYIPKDTVVYMTSLTNTLDLWGAKSWQIFRDYYSNYITSFILSARYLRLRYQNPPLQAEQKTIFQRENIFFAGVGITSRKYDKDRYIFNYGKIEDVPIGRSLNVNLGFDTGQKNRFYLGLKASWGNYYPSGYLSSQFEYGTFIGKAGFEQSVLSVNVNYFTRLMILGKWKIRQFIRPVFILGINRLPTENVTLSDEIKGFEGATFPARHIAVLNLQTQSYAPWNLYGFHFGPYLFCSLGMLGDKSGFIHSPLYSLIGLGILIKNDYLMFNNFQLSLSFYPVIPGYGHNVFRFNVYSTQEFGFTDFEIKKPAIANYR
jgi:hypothetical protein